MVFFKEVSGVKLAPIAIKDKLVDCDNYNTTIINTHIALYQVLGLQKQIYSCYNVDLLGISKGG